jgi:predicted transcriptional regulator
MSAQTAKKAPPYGAIALRKDIIEELDRLAAKLGLTRDELAEKALLTAMEDIDDELLADAAMKEWIASGKETVSLEEVEKNLGLGR